MDIFSAIWYAVFVPAAPGGQNYALFPENAAPQELDELFRRLEEGSLTAPPALDRPMPGRLTLPEDPRLARLVGEIGSYKYIQLVYQLRRDNGWEEVCDWGPFCVMRSTRPDTVPPPLLEAFVESAKKGKRMQNISDAMNLTVLLVTPVVTLLKGGIAGYAFWQKLLVLMVLFTLVCFVIYQLLLRRLMSPERWDIPYEECVRQMGRMTLLSYIITVGTAISVFIYPILDLMLSSTSA